MGKKYVTGKGIAVYPKLTREDMYNGNPVGYKTGLRLQEADLKALKELCEETFIEEFGAKKLDKAKMPFKEDGEGNVVVNFATKQKPKLFDSKGKPVMNTEELNIGGGSVLKIAGSCNAYNAGGSMGVKLYMNQVQIIDLQEFNGSAFGAEEGGFVAAAEEKFAEVSSEDIDF